VLIKLFRMFLPSFQTSFSRRERLQHGLLGHQVVDGRSCSRPSL